MYRLDGNLKGAPVGTGAPLLPKMPRRCLAAVAAVLREREEPIIAKLTGLKFTCPPMLGDHILSVNVPNHIRVHFFSPVDAFVIGRAIYNVFLEKEFRVTVHKNQVGATVMS